MPGAAGWGERLNPGETPLGVSGGSGFDSERLPTAHVAHYPQINPGCQENTGGRYWVGFPTLRLKGLQVGEEVGELVGSEGVAHGRHHATAVDDALRDEPIVCG